MATLTYANLVLRFLLELCALAAFGYWGYQVDQGQAVKVALAVGLPLLGALVWGLGASPKAPLVAGPSRWITQTFVFAAAVVALAAAGQTTLAIIFGVVSALNAALLRMLGRSKRCPCRPDCIRNAHIAEAQAGPVGERLAPPGVAK
jgi:hypothetical protein